MEVNSVEYWNQRFETDWSECGGNGQTIFFANTLCNLLPDWFVEEIKVNKYSICDLGCADGDALPIWSNFFGLTEVCGEDFSENAILNARKKYPEFMYLVSDIMRPEGKRQYGVVISSNTVEHFKDTKAVLENICKRSKKYAVIMLPYREDEYPTEEHENVFHTDNIPCCVGGSSLIYVKTCQCNSKYYIAEQIVLIYSKEPKDVMLSDIVEHVNTDAYKALETVNEIANQKCKELENNNTAILQMNTDLENSKTALENEKLELEKSKSALIVQVSALENEKVLLVDEKAALENEKMVLESQKATLEEEKETLKNEKIILENKKLVLEGDIDRLKSDQELLGKEVGSVKQMNDKLEKENAELRCKLEESELRLENSENRRVALEARINSAVIMCKELTNWGLYKFSHMLHRTKHQFLSKSSDERKNYIKWITGYLKGNGTDSDNRFKPICRIIEILKGQDNEINIEAVDSELGSYIKSEEQRLDDGNVDIEEIREIQKILSTHEYKGILVYPHVVYWEPLQTPQQLLRSFAKLGWLCFFCEHPNLEGIFREVEKNVVIVHEKEFLSAISDHEVTVLLTWLGSSAFLNRIKNKKVWYHLLDKLDLFPYFDDSYLELHHKIVGRANQISYVAKPLESYILGRKDAVYLPNGVNPEEFLNIHEDFIPQDMTAIVNTGHKIIGYYGYIAEWMDYEMVRAAAIARPNYEFVFIGKAIHDTSLFDGISNIHLLGLKSYGELSDYAKLFDVATIPFVINETMDCVSPIKFYEYCALGLPVITSKMKEMEKYVCEYIACIDGYDEFLFYLDKLTQNKYKELAGEKAKQIAEDNTWLARARVIENSFNKELGIVLGERYTNFDVIMLGVIDFDFRFQRPQQLAVRYAQNGHRVFYFNANHFNEYSVCELRKNLHVINLHNNDYSAIHLTDWCTQEYELREQVNQVIDSYCIRDAVVVVDYPNWVHLAETLRVEYGFKIVTDYMDDYTGFLNPAEALVKRNCEKLLATSDMVVASSQFLYDIAGKYNANVKIIRNGTEFTHFHSAFGNTEHERKVIGYYGAIAEWFQIAKVVYLAVHFPECDIVLVGHVTCGEHDLKRYSNIKLLGEKPYDTLPEYLKDFDVCIIPFDTSTNLIKATNPVKFYEYLSAGKKIVSTEIPELEPYRNEYVYMANENEKFADYVKKCLSGEDTLRSPKECADFARMHDWQERYEKFKEASMSAIPKISIVVLTFNNLEINKICIKSILEKTAYPNYELIVVDNCSSDGTREYLLELSETVPGVKVILNEKNLGFAAGNNVGIKAADGNYVVLLNNDTLITRGWLTAMAKHLENDKALGMCGPVTNSIGNEAKIKVDYHSMSGLERFSYIYTTKHLGEEYRDINVLALFCTMIKKQVIEECGYLDENYGVGMFEDDDYAEAVKAKGYLLAIAEDAFVHHFEGVSFKKLEEEEFMRIFNTNKQLFERKWSTQWIKHKNREGVAPTTNIDNTVL